MKTYKVKSVEDDDKAIKKLCDSMIKKGYRPVAMSYGTFKGMTIIFEK